MTDEQMNECRQQLATITTARYQLAQVTDWLEGHRDLIGAYPYVRPNDLAILLYQTGEKLAFIISLFMSFIDPAATPDSILQASQEAK